MPNYDVECSKCGIKGEVRAKNTAVLGRCGCGGSLEWVPSAHTAVFKPFIHPHLGHEPVLIESWKQFKQILKERNLRNELAS